MKFTLATLVLLLSAPVWAADYCYTESLAAALSGVVNGSGLEALANGSFKITQAVASATPGFNYTVTIGTTLSDLNGNVYSNTTQKVEVRVKDMATCSTAVQLDPARR